MQFTIIVPISIRLILALAKIYDRGEVQSDYCCTMVKILYISILDKDISKI